MDKYPIIIPADMECFRPERPSSPNTGGGCPTPDELRSQIAGNRGCLVITAVATTIAIASGVGICIGAIGVVVCLFLHGAAKEKHQRLPLAEQKWAEYQRKEEEWKQKEEIWKTGNPSIIKEGRRRACARLGEIDRTKYSFANGEYVGLAEITLFRLLEQDGLEPLHQYPVGGYTLDIGCVDQDRGIMLDIEVDGHQHWTKKQRLAHDDERNQSLASGGWTIIRFRNDQVRALPRQCAVVVRVLLEAITDESDACEAAKCAASKLGL